MKTGRWSGGASCLLLIGCFGTYDASDYSPDSVLARNRAAELAGNPAWAAYVRHDSLVIDSIARTIVVDTLYRLGRLFMTASNPGDVHQLELCEQSRLMRAHGLRALELAMKRLQDSLFTAEDKRARERAWARIPARSFGLGPGACGGRFSGPEAPDSVSGVSLGAPMHLMYWKPWPAIEGLDSALALMKSDTTALRMRGWGQLSSALAKTVADLPEPKQREAWPWSAKRYGLVSLAIIQLLERENARAHAPGAEGFDEEYSEYYAGLISVVADLRDQRATRALAGAITTGAMATTGMARLGDAALPELQRLLESADVSVRVSATIALGQIPRERTVDLSSVGVETVRELLLRGLADRSDFVPLSAIEALRQFKDTGVASAMYRVAIDRSRRGKRADRTRATAQQWLDSITPPPTLPDSSAAAILDRIRRNGYDTTPWFLAIMRNSGTSTPAKIDSIADGLAAIALRGGPDRSTDVHNGRKAIRMLRDAGSRLDSSGTAYPGAYDRLRRIGEASRNQELTRLALAHTLATTRRKDAIAFLMTLATSPDSIAAQAINAIWDDETFDNATPVQKRLLQDALAELHRSGRVTNASALERLKVWASGRRGR